MRARLVRVGCLYHSILMMMKKISLLVILMMGLIAASAEKPMQLNLEKGKTYYQVISTQNTIVQQPQGMSIELEMGINQTLAYKVVDVKDSLFFTEITLSKLKTSIKSPFGIMEFSSESIDLTDKTSQILAELSRHPFHATLTQSGRIVKIDVDSLLKAAINASSGLDDDEKVSMTKQILDSYGEKSIRQGMESSLAFYPPAQVEKGSRWTTRRTLENIVTFTSDNQLEITDVTGDSYTIRCLSQMSIPENSAPTSMNGMDAKCSLNGTSEGSITVSKATGWVISSSMSQALKGTIDILPNAQVPQGMQVPLTLKGVTTITQ
jgi:hypothetical protein